MRVLVACEFSGVVRDAFRRRGHDAYSCDILPNDSPYHLNQDVVPLLTEQWDLMIAHPPCTALCVSGNRHYTGTTARQEAVEFVRLFLDAPIEKICVENPVGVLSTTVRKPDQYIQPWQFGHGETKKTGLWLKGLPKLVPTAVVPGRDQRIWKMGPSPDRGLLRSVTYRGIAEAMAEQWG